MVQLSSSTRVFAAPETLDSEDTLDPPPETLMNLTLILFRLEILRHQLLHHSAFEQMQIRYLSPDIL
ncbi:hypothetical protein GH714_006945 [Hevea brasiliensis]|uniref:Uncharacterized protein n=1 Tax=Hevea brasiliensis TaxID=3981 RepID=A0A6A6LYY8_HEVBR|nr:hypothetical protein GH714_006945 [Hevea brasiliensis]